MPQGNTVEDLMDMFLTNQSFRNELIGSADPDAVLRKYGFSSPQSFPKAVIDRLTTADPVAVQQAVDSYARGEDPNSAC